MASHTGARVDIETARVPDRPAPLGGRAGHRLTRGHAVSTDLRQWTQVDDALVHDDRPSFDDIATWTGSVVRGPDGLWRMYYTGVGSLTTDSSNGSGWPPPPT